MQYAEVAGEAEARLEELLTLAAEPSPAVDFDALRRDYVRRPLPPAVHVEPPRWADFEPPFAPETQQGGHSLLDSGYQNRLAEARLRHQRALREYREQERVLRDRAEQLRLTYEREEQDRARVVREYNERLAEYRSAYERGDTEAVESVLERALASAGRLPGVDVTARVAYRQLTRTAVVDLLLPGPGIVPPALEFEVTDPEQGGGVQPIPRAPEELTLRYVTLLARLVLRALDALLAADTEARLDGVVLNGRVVTAQAGETTVLSVDARRAHLYARTLLPGDHGDALRRLRELPLRLSAAPLAAAPITPHAVGGRTAPTPEELSAGEFAGLVAELFEATGLLDWDPRLAGRDGVLATATTDSADPAAGAVVVCAARRPPLVGADAVRTVAQVCAEEHAAAGIWATTGSFAPDAVVAAAGLPGMRLIDGGELRALIREHLGQELGG